MTRVALKGLRGRKLRAVADRARDRPRRRDGQRHASCSPTRSRPASARSSRRLPDDRRGDHRQERDRRRQQRPDIAPSFPASLLDAVRALPDVAGADGRRSATRRSSSGGTARSISHGGAPGLAFSVNATRRPALQPAHAVCAARGRTGDTRSRSTRTRRRTKHFAVGQTIGVRRTRRRCSSSGSPGSSKLGQRRLARRRDAGDLRSADRPGALPQGRASSTRSTSRRSRASTPRQLVSRDPADPAAARRRCGRRSSRRRSRRRTRATRLSFLQ